MGRPRPSTIASSDGAGSAIFDRIFAALAAEGPKPERIMVDSTHLKAHRTAASLLKRMARPVRKSVASMACSVCINVSGLRAFPGQDGYPRGLDPHKGDGVERRI
jgi:hypothetical protein